MYLWPQELTWFAQGHVANARHQFNWMLSLLVSSPDSFCWVLFLGSLFSCVCLQPPEAWITALGFEHSQHVIFYKRALLSLSMTLQTSLFICNFLASLSHSWKPPHLSTWWNLNIQSDFFSARADHYEQFWLWVGQKIVRAVRNLISLQIFRWGGSLRVRRQKISFVIWFQSCRESPSPHKCPSSPAYNLLLSQSNTLSFTGEKNNILSLAGGEYHHGQVERCNKKS